jgi:malate dehydrogenase (oxaloacetate-decarboxylating)(NADP+)
MAKSVNASAEDDSLLKSALIAELKEKSTPLEKYNFLQEIQHSSEIMFTAILADFPLGEIFPHQPKQISVSMKNLSKIESILHNYPNKDIKVISLTWDNSSDDLGANAMGIPIGKLALATAFAGIHPEEVLPVTIDVGSSADSILNDPAYIGARQKRDRSENYDKLIDEFFVAQRKYTEELQYSTWSDLAKRALSVFSNGKLILLYY